MKMHGHLLLIKPILIKMEFDEFKFKVIELILAECPGRSTTSINVLIDRNIEVFCTDYFNETSIENTAKNILHAEIYKIDANRMIH